jgi:excisionase family DNA binding protein
MKRDDSKTQKTPLPEWLAEIERGLPLLAARQVAAETLGVTTKTIDRRIRAGQLVAVTHGARVLIPRKAIIDLLMAGAA